MMRLLWLLPLGLTLLALTSHGDRDIGALDEPSRAARIARLAEMGPGGWIQLQKLAGHAEPSVRAAVARGLRDVDGQVGLPLIDKLLLDIDPTVQSAAVSSLLLGLREAGILRLKQLVARDPERLGQLEASARYWSGIYAVEELIAIRSVGTGWYPRMFWKLEPLGSWVTKALLRIFSRPANNRIISPLQRLAGQALGDLQDPGAIKGLLRIGDTVRGIGAEYHKEVAAVALFKLGRPQRANLIVRTLERKTRPGGYSRDRIAQFLIRLAGFQHQLSRFRKAIAAYRLTLDMSQGKQYAPLANYNMACAYARIKMPEHALHHLQQAVKLGYDRQKKWIAVDRELDLIRKDPRFAKMLENPQAVLKFDLAKEKQR